MVKEVSNKVLFGELKNPIRRIMSMEKSSRAVGMAEAGKTQHHVAVWFRIS